MGVTLYANNSTYSFDMGAGSFFHLRANIAKVWDKQFGEHYEKLLSCHSKEEYDDHDRISDEILSHPRFKDEDADILDFLYASDCGGKIGYKTCGKIYNLIKDVDFGNKCIRYVAYSHNDWEEFKAFLKECYSHRRTARWE